MNPFRRRTTPTQPLPEPSRGAVGTLQPLVDEHIIIAVTDRRGTIIRVNRAFERISGYTEEELVGQNHRILSSGVHSKDFWKQMWKTVSSGNAWHGEVCNRSKDGRVYWVDTTIFPLKSDDGRIYGYLAVRIEIADTKRIHTALVDSLTGLPGRAFLMHRLRTLLQRAPSRPGRWYALCFIDLDNFKYVNDSLGHGVGDRMLLETARRLTSALSTSEHGDVFAPIGIDHGSFAARFGGDEFIVLLDDMDSIDQAIAIADRIRDKMAAPVIVNDHDISLQCSIGIATGCGDENYRDADSLLRDADTAMYQAKAAGKGCYALFDEQMHTTVRRRLMLEGDLRNAIANNQIIGMYQPIVDLESGQVVSFEVLARWTHSHFGPISPAEFIPIAEETGLIIPMTHALIERAMDLLGQLSAEPRGHNLRMNVNVSRRQLCDPTFLEWLGALLARTGLEPHRLCLEVTESAVTSSPDRVRECLSRLKSLGVQLHMDDFGTGLSSLSLLRTLPLDGIKIDKSFIEVAEGDPESIAILHAIVTLGRNLRKVVTAEGIESATHVATVLGLDCDLAQGWIFGAAVLAEEAAGILGRDFSASIVDSTPLVAE